jgi:hypothetical protein
MDVFIGPISEKEVRKAIQKLKNGKAPGTGKPQVKMKFVLRCLRQTKN